MRAYANQRGVPQLFVASGASEWGDGSYPWTIGFQPTYAAEARVYAAHLLETRPHATVAVLCQNDDFGHELLTAFEGAVAGTGVGVVARRSYEVMDADVQAQMAESGRVRGGGVFLNVGTPKFAAPALAADAAMTDWNPLHLLNGVANHPSLIAAVGPSALRGVLTTNFYKDPAAWPADPAVRTYLSAVGRLRPRRRPVELPGHVRLDVRRRVRRHDGTDGMPVPRGPDGRRAGPARRADRHPAPRHQPLDLTGRPLSRGGPGVFRFAGRAVGSGFNLALMSHVHVDRKVLEAGAAYRNLLVSIDRPGARRADRRDDRLRRRGALRADLGPPRA